MMRLVLVSCLVILFSCNDERKGYISKDNNGGDEVYSIANDDDQMNKAVHKASASYETFLKEYNNPSSPCSDFSIKLMFPYDGGNEHMWLNGLFYKNEKLFGVLDSDPVQVNSVKAGDTVEVKQRLVSDWMYLRNDTLVGGYTIRVLYVKMNEKEKKKFRQEVGFVID